MLSYFLNYWIIFSVLCSIAETALHLSSLHQSLISGRNLVYLFNIRPYDTLLTGELVLHVAIIIYLSLEVIVLLENIF